MRDYGKVHTSFWSSETLKGLDDDARFLALYLLTCQHGNMIGCFRIPLAYASEDTGWTVERLRNSFATVSGSGWMAWDQATGWIWIRKWLKWNPPANPNQWKAADKLMDQVPSSVNFFLEFASGETVAKRLNNTPVPAPVPAPVALRENDEPKTDLPGIPLLGGDEFHVPADLALELRTAYPHVDLRAEIAKARVWCAANPDKRKTRRGAAKFLNSWLGRAAKDAPPPVKRRLKELA